jgi:hypothetical protein
VIVTVAGRPVRRFAAFAVPVVAAFGALLVLLLVLLMCLALPYEE